MRRLLLVFTLLLGGTLAQLSEEVSQATPESNGGQITLIELLRYLQVYGWKFSFFPESKTQWLTAQIVRVRTTDGSVTPLTSLFIIQSSRAIDQLDITLLLDYRALRSDAPVTGSLSLNNHTFPLTFAKGSMTDFIVFGNGDGGGPLMVDNEMILLARFPEGVAVSEDREAMLEYVRLDISEQVRVEIGSRD
jgi:hypothetical protein